MPDIHEVATITTKGQITLPKRIRQVLSVAVGSKVAFDLRDSQVFICRVEGVQHEDPAIVSFLALFEKDIECGRHFTTLSQDLANAMLAASKHPV